MPEVLVQIPLVSQKIFCPDMLKAWMDPKEKSQNQQEKYLKTEIRVIMVKHAGHKS